MTEREPVTAHATPQAISLASVSHYPYPAHDGNGLLMTATLVPRSPVSHVSHGSTTEASGERLAHTAERGRLWLTQLFAGQFPFEPLTALPHAHTERTTTELAVLSRVAACGDLFAVHADPHTGEKFIVDLADTVDTRILVMAPDSTIADRIADRLLTRGIATIRTLAEDDNPARQFTAVSARTPVALGVPRAQQECREAATQLTAAETRMSAFASVEKAIARLREVNEHIPQIEQLHALQMASRDQCEATVRSETGTPFAEEFAKRKAEYDETETRLTAELRTATATELQQTQSLSELKNAHAEATRKTGFFSRFFSKPKPGTPTVADLEQQIQSRETELTATRAIVAQLQKQLTTNATAFAAQRDERLTREIANRRATIETQLAALDDELKRAHAEANALNKVIAAAVPNDTYAVAEQHLLAARETALRANATAAQLLAEIVSHTRVFVATPKCLESDCVLTAINEQPPFGLLVLDRAEELQEADFVRLTRLAERCVLVGDAFPANESRASHRRGSRAADVPFFAKLAKLLDRETWAMEADRLVCRLLHMTPEQRNAVTREPLADRPDIELRFVTPDDEPLLAEIVFPPRTSFATAKSFLFHELGEVLLKPLGEQTWSHTQDAITANWNIACPGECEWIELEAGVREQVVGNGIFAYTSAVQFNPANGWDAERAAEWLAQHCPAPSCSRFALLPRTANAQIATG